MGTRPGKLTSDIWYFIFFNCISFEYLKRNNTLLRFLKHALEQIDCHTCRSPRRLVSIAPMSAKTTKNESVEQPSRARGHRPIIIDNGCLDPGLCLYDIGFQPYPAFACRSQSAAFLDDDWFDVLDGGIGICGVVWRQLWTKQQPALQYVLGCFWPWSRVPIILDFRASDNDLEKGRHECGERCISRPMDSTSPLRLGMIYVQSPSTLLCVRPNLIQGALRRTVCPLIG